MYDKSLGPLLTTISAYLGNQRIGIAVPLPRIHLKLQSFMQRE